MRAVAVSGRGFTPSRVCAEASVLCVRAVGKGNALGTVRAILFHVKADAACPECRTPGVFVLAHELQQTDHLLRKRCVAPCPAYQAWLVSLLTLSLCSATCRLARRCRPARQLEPSGGPPSRASKPVRPLRV